VGVGILISVIGSIVSIALSLARLFYGLATLMRYL